MARMYRSKREILGFKMNPALMSPYPADTVQTMRKANNPSVSKDSIGGFLLGMLTR